MMQIYCIFNMDIGVCLKQRQEFRALNICERSDLQYNSPTVGSISLVGPGGSLNLRFSHFAVRNQMIKIGLKKTCVCQSIRGGVISHDVQDIQLQLVTE